MRMDLGPLKSRWRNIATAPRSETLAWLAVFFATFSTIVLGRFACNCVLTKVGNPCVQPGKKKCQHSCPETDTNVPHGHLANGWSFQTSLTDTDGQHLTGLARRRQIVDAAQSSSCFRVVGHQVERGLPIQVHTQAAQGQRHSKGQVGQTFINNIYKQH